MPHETLFVTKSSGIKYCLRSACLCTSCALFCPCTCSHNVYSCFSSFSSVPVGRTCDCIEFRTESSSYFMWQLLCLSPLQWTFPCCDVWDFYGAMSEQCSWCLVHCFAPNCMVWRSKYTYKRTFQFRFHIIVCFMSIVKLDTAYVVLGGVGERPFRKHGYMFVLKLVRSGILDCYGCDSYSGYLQFLPVKA